jgi:pimeloyl-ACP methyl ester carboxylesterase
MTPPSASSLPAATRVAADEDDVRCGEYPAEGYTLSGIEAGPVDGGRGVVVALHGSGYSSRYWDANADPDNSLLRLGARLGYCIVAIDRPGYCATGELVDTAVPSLENQSRLLGVVIRGLRQRCPAAPLFLMGHSLGSLLAVRLAARECATDISGLDLTGLPVIWRPELHASVSTGSDRFGAELRKVGSRAALFFGPPATYDASMLTPAFAQRIPRIEMSDSLASPELLRALAPEVQVPVQCTVAEYERALMAGREAVERDIALFTASPRTVSRWQPGAGHNVSLHWIARAYHLRALAFFDEVTAMNGAGRVDPAQHQVGIVG